MVIYHPIVATLTNPDIHKYLVSIDPSLDVLFKTIGPESFTNLPKLPYVALIGAVIGQIVRYTKAKSIRSKLYQVCGSKFGPDAINKLTDNDWLYVGLDPSKVEIILRMNQYILTNDINLNNIDEVRKLKNIKGIGEWTVNTTILTSFLDWDTFVCGDLFVRKKIKKLYKLYKLPTISETRAISERWSPYRSIVAWYLWRWFD